MSPNDQVQAVQLDHLLTLQGVEELEVALRPHVQRLMSRSWRARSQDSGRAHFADRPGWWWRVQLIEWSGRLKTSKHTNEQVLKGFRDFIRHCSEAEVCDLVRGLVEQEGIQESA
jgi:hypothetical protein